MEPTRRGAIPSRRSRSSKETRNTGSSSESAALARAVAASASSTIAFSSGLNCRTCDSNSGKLPPKESLKAGVAKAHATTSAQPNNLRLMTASPEDIGSTQPASPHRNAESSSDALAPERSIQMSEDQGVERRGFGSRAAASEKTAR